MTPLQIKMMLHYYCIAEPYAAHEPAHANSIAVKEQRELLQDLELIKQDSCNSLSGYKLTPRGYAYIRALLAVKLPVNKWVQP